MAHVQEGSTGRRLSIAELPVFNVLHSNETDAHNEEENHADDDDDHDDHHKSHGHGGHKGGSKREVQESFDFTDVESMAWRKVRCIILY